MAKTFIDTNVLFYMLDAKDPIKRRKARAQVRKLSASGEALVSTQVAYELANNIVCKLHKSPADAVSLCRGLRRLPILATSLDTLDRTLLVMQAASLSFWDASILASASEGGCSVLLSEDLQHGRVIAGVRIVNPFV